MANAIEYTNRSSVMSDLNLYVAWRSNDTLTLAHLPKLAADRWTWIVQNWSKLKVDFKNLANGDSYLEENLQILDANVLGWNSGTKVNPLQSLSYFSTVAEFLQTVTLNSINLTVAENVFISQEIQRVSQFTLERFQAMLRYLRAQRDNAFELIGLGDADYAAYKKRNMLPKQRDSSTADLDQIGQMITVEDFILGIILEFKYKTNTEPNLMLFAQQQLSEDSQIAFNTAYKSYILVPFEQSLEQMANDYLGSKNLWYDLVTANQLKPPFVDTQGIKIYITEPGAGVALRVDSTYADRMRIGNIVTIGSRTVPAENRVIEGVVDNLDGTLTLFFRGASDLNKLQPLYKAYIKVYAPETIQEFSFIKIPQTLVPVIPNSPPPRTQALKELDHGLYAFGVDLAFNPDTQDLVVSQAGDLKMQYGISAVQQAVYMKLHTPIGQLPLHPDFGFDPTVGNQMFGAPTLTTLSEVIKSVILKDARFTSASIKDITTGNTGGNMKIDVQVAKLSDSIPFSFAF